MMIEPTKIKLGMAFVRTLRLIVRSLVRVD